MPNNTLPTEKSKEYDVQDSIVGHALHNGINAVYTPSMYIASKLWDEDSMTGGRAATIGFITVAALCTPIGLAAAVGTGLKDLSIFALRKPGKTVEECLGTENLKSPGV